MGQAFVIVLREGFESFLIVAITIAYLRRTCRETLIPAVGWGIVSSIIFSIILGYLVLQTASEPAWETAIGLVSALLVAAFVVHMWRTAPHLKSDMESKLAHKVSAPGRSATLAVFIFTTVMIAREGMETALMLLQVHTPGVLAGAAFGVAGAASLAWLWGRVGYLIDLSQFFRVTSLFLLLFVAQILIHTFHELTETGWIPNIEHWHALTEPYGPDGVYGRWISLASVAVCLVWLLWAQAKAVLTGKRRVRG